MTLLETLSWCRKCGHAPCKCSVCHGAGLLSGPGPMGTTVKCPVCSPAPVAEPPEPGVRQPRHGYQERLNG